MSKIWCAPKLAKKCVQLLDEALNQDNTYLSTHTRLLLEPPWNLGFVQVRYRPCIGDDLTVHVSRVCVVSIVNSTSGWEGRQRPDVAGVHISISVSGCARSLFLGLVGCSAQAALSQLGRGEVRRAHFGCAAHQKRSIPYNNKNRSFFFFFFVSKVGGSVLQCLFCAGL